MTKRQHFAAAIQAEETKQETQTKAVEEKSVPVAPSRAGKVTITTYVSPETKKQLKVVALENDSTQDALFKEALNLLFKQYGKSPIA